jgi:hypothetical protein
MYTVLITITAFYHSIVLTFLFFLRLQSRTQSQIFAQVGRLYWLTLPLALISPLLGYQADLLWAYLIFGTYVVVALLLDQVLRIQFRSRPQIIVPYVILYYMANYAIVILVWSENTVLGWITAALVVLQVGINLASHILPQRQAPLPS